ncbi:MAG: NAD(P)H-dependent oxidoreductase [Enhydrobacter sp.]|nr:MAG: NAD(P)H-dependent oxidoreductase [Enhydrobacter sp.]
MLIQVVHCHPLTESFDHALFGTIVETLRANRHDVVATDLYREEFQPAMTAAERRSYMGNDYDVGAFESYATTLKRIDGLILCFPHWWFSMPAMLKGWLDRVWGPGVAFTYREDDRKLVPALANIKLFGVVTSYGSPWWVVRLMAGNAGYKVLTRGMKPLCAANVRFFYLAKYNMDHTTDEARRRFLDVVRRRISRI